MQKHQIETLINYLEEFMQAVVHNINSNDVQDAIVLNRKRSNLEEYLNDLAGIKSESEDESEVLKCPECGADMKLRTNRQNGNKFWGCVKYPNCKGTRDENGLSREEREEAKLKKDSAFNQESGFSFNKTRNKVTEVGPDPRD